MQIANVLQFKEIETAKQFVVDEMLQLWRNDGRTLVITFSSETYIESVLKALHQKSEDACVELVKFDDESSLYTQLAQLAAHRFRHVVVFNSFHRLTSLDDLDAHLSRLLDEQGMLHLSWPAQSVLGYTSELKEIDIARQVTDRLCQSFDMLRKSDQAYLQVLQSFHCQRLSKFDFNLAFDDLDAIKSWHQGGADLLFGAEAERAEEKEVFYAALFEHYQSGRYQACMTTSVADLTLK
ncbi:hypothetical protein [Vibrio lentus]|uniref:Uncharacterized protein n=1 Tax=Vibrio lentus TaxID=136468 RepID=A0A2N7BJ41_9VIBR|nr:hypothetical protein [Vibrio lentus]PME48237.1 hypothetical protein BCV34_15965 [Vibrio lentus]PME56554.1 hypothetical protein BCV30_19095 [Vibrio lentus]PME92357.1 hypothetical protein BCV27_21990 [Vibrio lentus]PMI12042.1 hypothetical protein BCU53_21850 [Vibrio lentus]PMK88826.1 hypothetical protein BCT90_06080 [Vibrio lentus]